MEFTPLEEILSDRQQGDGNRNASYNGNGNYPPPWCPSVGDVVKASDWGNFGKVLELSESGDQALVHFDGKDGTRDKWFSMSDLSDPNTAPPMAPSELLTISDVLKIQHPGWVVDRLLCADSLACIFGEPGAGKSFVLLDLLLAIARGVPWHGFETIRSPVAYLCAEGGNSLGLRLRAWMKAYSITVERLTSDAAPVLISLTVPRLTEQGAVESLAGAIAERLGGQRVGMIAIDTLSRALCGKDENKAEVMSAAVDAADQLRRLTGGSVLLCHHTGKDKSAGERGSSALRGGVDTLLELKRADEKGIQIAVRKQKDGAAVAPLSLALEPVHVGHDEKGRSVTSCVVRKQGLIEASIGLAKSSRAILELLGLEQYAEGLTPSEVKALCGDMANSTFHMSCKPLLGQKLVRKKGAKYLIVQPEVPAEPMEPTPENGAPHGDAEDDQDDEGENA